MSIPICLQFPLECPECSAVSGMPYMASTLPEGAVGVDLRCGDCRHEWRCVLLRGELSRDGGESGGAEE